MVNLNKIKTNEISSNEKKKLKRVLRAKVMDTWNGPPTDHLDCKGGSQWRWETSRGEKKSHKDMTDVLWRHRKRSDGWFNPKSIDSFHLKDLIIISDAATQSSNQLVWRCQLFISTFSWRPSARNVLGPSLSRTGWPALEFVRGDGNNSTALRERHSGIFN